MDFFTRMASIWAERRTLLCVGLDPRIEDFSDTPKKAAAVLLERNRRVIDATAAFAACYKPNAAFYEAWGPAGWEALAATLEHIPPNIPVIIDAKRGDIDTTARAYARALLGVLEADAVTLSPYLGRDAVDPFLEYPNAGLFVLCRTSNPRAGVFQDIPVALPSEGGPDGLEEPLYLRVARECASWSDRVGLVVAGNDTRALMRVRAAVPDAWFLAPGIGAQGGDIVQAWRAGARSDGLGLLPAASRAVAEAEDPGSAAEVLVDSIRNAFEEVQEEREAGRSRGASRSGSRGSPAAAADETEKAATAPEVFPGSRAAALKEKLLRALVAAGCFKTGDFILKSGLHSPFYIDLRSVVSDVGLLETAAEAYAMLAEGIEYDRLGGIPAAALPLATAAALRVRKPLVWPRMPVKDHGSGNRVEGRFAVGERILLLDDLITTGKSKLEAVEILRGEGLRVEDVAVLIERGTQGKKDLEAAGLRLHAFVHVRELIALCVSLGLVSADKGGEMRAFVDTE